MTSLSTPTPSTLRAEMARQVCTPLHAPTRTASAGAWTSIGFSAILPPPSLFPSSAVADSDTGGLRSDLNL
jgi:hypothetical protein